MVSNNSNSRKRPHRTSTITTAALALTVVLLAAPCQQENNGLLLFSVSAYTSSSSSRYPTAATRLLTTTATTRAATGHRTSATSFTRHQQQQQYSRRTLSSSSRISMVARCDEDQDSICDGDSSSLGKKEEEPFELHVGRALDTLRADYPKILTKNPNFAIYDPTIEFVDPGGVKVHGLRQYKGAFGVLHALLQVIYCPARSSISYRMCYDKARQNIRVSWNVEVVPREIFGGLRTVGHVDGISVYELDRRSGNITQHRIEHLLFNDSPVKPIKEGVIEQMRREHAVTVPSLYVDQGGTTTVRFQTKTFFGDNKNGAASPLFALEATGGDPDQPQSRSQKYPDLDWDALESKNKSRKKFGLKPLTPEEFMELEAQVRQLDSQQRAAAAASRQASNNEPVAQEAPPPSKGSFLDKMLGSVLPKDTCESNWDCERPEICCDFGFQKRCCSSGSLVFSGQMRQKQPVLVPVPAGEPYPPGQGPQDAPRQY